MASQPSTLSETQACAKQRDDVVPLDGRESSEELTGLLWCQRSTLSLAKQLVGVYLLLGRRHLADRIGDDQPLVLSSLQDAIQDRSGGHDRASTAFGLQLVLPATHDSDGDGTKLTVLKVGRTWSRNRA